MTWFFSLLIGFWVAYFLVFHVRNPLLALGLFLLCTVPFWTSNIIRMISWIPLLGKEGLINSALIKTGVIHEPLELLLFSGFAVVVAYVHQLTIFMIVPIFNSMARIDKRVVEAARGRRRQRASTSCAIIVLPLSKTGIALGSIFVVSIVMGDFFVIKVMSGGGSASVVGALYEDIGVLQYPTAAASAVDADRHRDAARRGDPAHRRHPQGDDAMTDDPPQRRRCRCAARRRRALAPSRGGRPWTFYVLATLFTLYVSRSMGRWSASTSCRSRTSAAVWCSR